MEESVILQAMRSGRIKETLESYAILVIQGQQRVTHGIVRIGLLAAFEAWTGVPTRDPRCQAKATENEFR